MRRRFALAVLLWLCLGFEWPGRLPHLRFELTHAEPARRREVVRMLAHYPVEDVREALLEALEDDDQDVRLQAAAVLGPGHVTQAVPTLSQWLGDQDEAVRLAAVQALGQIADAHTREAVTRLLGDGAPSVRAAAVRALGRLGDSEALPTLLASLDDADVGVRQAAVAALSGNRDGRVPEALARRLRDDDGQVRAAALAALGDTPAPQALSWLLAGVNDSLPDVRMAAVVALGQLHDNGALEALRAQLTREPQVAKAALCALGHLTDPRAQALLVEALGDAELSATSQAALVEHVRALGAARAQDAQASREPSIVQALIEVIERPRSPQQLHGAAEALTQLSQLTSIADASPALQKAVREGTPPDRAILLALAATADPQALAPLLERLELDPPAGLPDVTAALESYFARVAPDGLAADPLLARLAARTDAAQPARAQLARWLGLAGATRAAVPLAALLASATRAEQLAVIDALGRLHVAQTRTQLWPFLQARDGELRYAAAHALRELVDEADLLQLLEMAAGTRPGNRESALLVLGPALARLAASHVLSEPTRTLALATLAALCTGDDPGLASRALSALRAFAPKEGGTLVAQLLRSPSQRVRASAAFAFAAFDGEDNRRLLRYLLHSGSPRMASAATVALGEVGDQRDVGALVRVTARPHWPQTATVAYALARMSQRGVVKQRTLQRTLCELARSRDPYVRANVAAAMAGMAAPACNESVDPLRWLQAEHAPVVRAAAARWARAAAAAGAVPAAQAAAALRACTTDPDASVAGACGWSQPSTSPGPLETRVYAGDGVSLLRDRLVALRLADGTVFVGYSDENGEVQLRAAPQAQPLQEDPTATPREPR